MWRDSGGKAGSDSEPDCLADRPQHLSTSHALFWMMEVHFFEPEAANWEGATSVH